MDPGDPHMLQAQMPWSGKEKKEKKKTSHDECLLPLVIFILLPKVCLLFPEAISINYS